MANKLKFKIKGENFETFISRLDELSSIDDTIKLKIDNQHILMYSMLGGNVLLAFKNFLMNTKDVFDVEDFDYKLDIIIPNSKKFVKNLAFLKDQDKITLDVTYKESPDDEELYWARSMQISSGKFKVTWLGGEHYEMKDIDKNALKQRLDLKNRKWFFSISNGDF